MPGLPTAEMNEVLRWLAMLWLAGALSWPFLRWALPDPHDGAYLAARAFGWLAAGFLAWFAAALGLTGFASLGPLVAFAALGGLYLAFRGRASAPVVPIGRLLRREALFLALFALGLGQRLAEPALIGLEKFTNLAFLTATMQAETMPPPDAWMAGAGINYYYVGHAVAAAWANLVAVPADHAYQLAFATVFALTGSLVFHLVTDLVTAQGARIARLCGLIAAALVLFAGNGHSFLYQALRAWMPTTLPEFFYPNSTRYIGFDPPTGDKAFTEFPAYGFRVGDLHAHVLATPLWLLALVVALSILRQGWHQGGGGLVRAGLFGWLLGLAVMTNTWDAAILGLTALCVWALLWARPAEGGSRVDAMMAVALVALAAAFITAAPFLAEFKPFASGLALAGAHTPAWQLLVVYFPGIGVVLGLAWLLVRPGSGLPPEAGFGLALGLTVIALLVLPEIVYVDDIYGDDHARANTMFKLSFRSQPLLQILGLAVVGWLAARPGARAGVAAVAVLVPLLLPLAYARWTVPTRFTSLSLDGLQFLDAERPLVEGLAALPLAPGQPIIEAASDAFTDGARVATVTGRPSVLGWFGHEWLWRDDPEATGRRKAVVDRFYTDMPQPERCRLIARHGLRYAVLGQIERDRYPALDRAGLLALGRVVLSTEAGEVIEFLPRDRCGT